MSSTSQVAAPSGPPPARGLSSRVVDVLRAPCCGAGWRDGWICARCGQAYVDDGARLDLRLRTPRRVQLQVEVGAAPADQGVSFAPLPPLSPSAVDFTGVERPRHLSEALRSRIPQAAPGALALDLGCGDGQHRASLERAGFEWVGVDYDSRGAQLLADAHALPFADESMAMVLSVAVLEHLEVPAVAMAEVFRIVRPGACFLGTVAFLEPFHSRSYFHHTHLGTASVLKRAGFEVTAVAPSPEWTVLTAQAKNGLFPGLSKQNAQALVRPLELAHKAWWRLMKLRHPTMSDSERLLKTAGAFTFVARKPA